MYKIIGADKKEYGPVSADQIHRWISEGRMNGETLVQAAGDSAWKPLSAIPEFAEVLKLQAEPIPTVPPLFSAGATPVPPIEEILTRDYKLDIGGCISRGWATFKENMGVLIGGFLLIVVISIAVGGILRVISRMFSPAHAETDVVFSQVYYFISVSVSAVIMGPLMGGYFATVLKVIRRQPTGVGEVFSGFEKAFSQLFRGHLVMVVANALCLLPFNIVFTKKVGPILEAMANAQSSEVSHLLSQFLEAFTSTLPVFLLCMIPVVYLSVSWSFTLPLIIDRNLTFGAALNASWKMAGKHWWLVFGLTIVTGLINVFGILCCGIGVLFTVPLGYVITMCAYEVIFSQSDGQAH